MGHLKLEKASVTAGMECSIPAAAEALLISGDLILEMVNRFSHRPVSQVCVDLGCLRGRMAKLFLGFVNIIAQ